MPVLFGFGAVIAIVCTVLAITRMNIVHALVYLALSLLAAAVAIFALGAPYLAALEVIIYAGAIIVLFIFVTMMLNLGAAARRAERALQPGAGWVLPVILAGLLLGEFLYAILAHASRPVGLHAVPPAAVGLRLMNDYLLAVELASLLLMAGVIAAFHLGYGLQRRQDATLAASERSGANPKAGVI